MTKAPEEMGKMTWTRPCWGSGIPYSKNPTEQQTHISCPHLLLFSSTPHPLAAQQGLEFSWVQGAWHPATGWCFTKDKNGSFLRIPLQTALVAWGLCFLIKTVVLKAPFAPRTSSTRTGLFASPWKGHSATPGPWPAAIKGGKWAVKQAAACDLISGLGGVFLRHIIKKINVEMSGRPHPEEQIMNVYVCGGGAADCFLLNKHVLLLYRKEHLPNSLLWV